MKNLCLIFSLLTCLTSKSAFAETQESTVTASERLRNELNISIKGSVAQKISDQLAANGAYFERTSGHFGASGNYYPGILFQRGERIICVKSLEDAEISCTIVLVGASVSHWAE